MPDLLDDSVQIIGSDYNQKTIQWCSNNIPGVEFILNDLHPPLKLDSNEIDVAYAISVFTHLSYENIINWLNEIKRVLNSNGIFLFTTHGLIFTDRFTQKEQLSFANGEFVIRKKVKEGHRIYATFHPPEAMKKVLKDLGFEILLHEPGIRKSWGAEQDLWIIKKA